MVKAFHSAFNLPAASKPTLVEEQRSVLRQALLDEEVDELREAVANRNVVEIADALADIVYIAYGTAIEHGINLDVVVAEVHHSNMKKLGPDGKPIYREDGKVIKPEGWQPPQIAKILGITTNE